MTKPGFSNEDLLEMYYRMLLIRNFEQRSSKLYAAGDIPGFVHLSIGQEASAVGACWPLRHADAIVSNHRGHGHCLAKGADPKAMFGELMGKAVGTGRGMGGSMHIADFDRGIYGANGIVGAGLPIAVGVAEGFRQQQRPNVVVAFFGDGAVAQGAFHEALNLAAVRHLPVLFVCENNQYSEFSSFDDQHPVPVTARAGAYGVESASVDGNDVVAVASTVEAMVSRMRGGEGPFFLETVTYRWHGHYEGDPMSYRTAEELAQWKTKDPIAALNLRLRDRVGHDALSEVERRSEQVIAEAEAFAHAAVAADPAAMFDAVEVTRPEAGLANLEPLTVQGDREFKLMHAVHDAIEYSLRTDPTVYVAGVDVGAGNVFGLTRGLRDAFGHRVFDTPISESAVVGLAVGSAMTGCKPIMEIMYIDFIGVAFDQILNQVAKIHFMTGGKAPASLVIRTQFGAGRSSAAQHSQSLEALLAHIPGLTVVMPSTAEDTYGLLRAAVLDPNPVIFIEHRLQYGLKGIRPDAEHVVPLGQAAIRREGADVTVVSWSRMVHTALAAADVVSGDGVDVEVIDLRTVAPVDIESVLRSVRKTNKLVIVHEAHARGGLGAEIAAQVADVGVWYLDGPIKRVTPPFTPAPYAPALEKVWLPDVAQVVDAIREVAAG